MPAQPPDRPGCPKSPGGRRPLPDPAAVRLCLVPDPAPPYDAEPVTGDPGGRRLPAWAPAYAEPGHGNLTGGIPRGREAPGLASGQREGRPERDGTRAVPRIPAAAPGIPAATPGAPPSWQSRFAQVLAETLAGARPPHQMVPWTTEEALDRIRRLGPQLASQQRPRVRRVLTSVPATDVLEMAVVVGFGPRVRALAVRLERSGAHPASAAHPAARPGERAADRWVCTAVEAA
jgi:Family of unknown function (DUF6459)